MSRAGGPPHGGPGIAAPAPAIAAAVLSELRASKRTVLADAADPVWLAAPHLDVAIAAQLAVYPIRKIALRGRKGRGHGRATDWAGWSLRRGRFSLGLVVGEMFVDLAMLRRPLPLAGVIAPHVLRGVRS